MFVIKSILLIIVSRFKPFSPTEGPALGPPNMALPTVVGMCTSQTSEPQGLTSLQTKLVHELGAGSGEQGKREWGAGIVIRNP
jgi:hypothetical protein